MKYFSRAGKHNFVDVNNVVVGYDAEQHCCENHGWYLSEQRREDTNDADTIDHKTMFDYVFDPVFFEEAGVSGPFGEGKLVRFRLTAPGNQPDVFLHLFNVHNGYYSHGFEIGMGNTVIRSSYL